MRLTLASALAWGVLTLAPVAVASATEPIVAIWYSGTPAGVPRQDDLAAIRALGFAAIVWPGSASAELPSVDRMAAIVGLSVIVQSGADIRRSGQVLPAGEHLDIRVASMAAVDLPAAIWRGIARGARVISFDAGQPAGAGLGEPGHPLPPWIAPAVAAARQVSANALLFDQLHVVPQAIADILRSPAVEAWLMEGLRCWVVIAVNAGRGTGRATVRLPAAVPYALWVSLLNGSTMAMLAEPAGPQWSFELERGRAFVYVIDKTLR